MFYFIHIQSVKTIFEKFLPNIFLLIFIENIIENNQLKQIYPIIIIDNFLYNLLIYFLLVTIYDIIL